LRNPTGDEMKELIADLVWGEDLRVDRFVRVDRGVDGGYGAGAAPEGLISEGRELGHDRFRQGSLRFQMLRARD
jgi:hypothetical protein